MKIAIMQAAEMKGCKYIEGKVEEFEKRGHNVTLIGWNRYKDTKYELKGAKIKRFNAETPLGKRYYFLYLQLFWLWSFLQLVKESPNIVIYLNVDTVPPAFVYTKLFRKKSIHEMRDFYHYHFEKMPWPIPQGINLLTKLAMKHSKMVITSSKEVTHEFMCAHNIKDCVCIEHLNLPTEEDKKIISEFRGRRYDKFTVCYIGSLQKNRCVIELAKVAKKQPHINFIMGGIELEKGIADQCAKIVAGIDNFNYVGFISRDKMMEIVCFSHVIALLLDNTNKHHVVPLPNKVFESIYCHTPLITTKKTSSADIVAKYDIGIVLEKNRIEDMINAINLLQKDHKRWKEMSDNCINAEKYYESCENFKSIIDKLHDEYKI